MRARMDRYLSGEDIDAKVLIEDLEKAVARGSFYPVIPASSPLGIGMAELLEVMTQAFPSPAEHPLPPVTSPGWQAGQRLVVRPERAAARRGRADHIRPVRRPDQPGPGLLRHASPGRHRAGTLPVTAGRTRVTGYHDLGKPHVRSLDAAAGSSAPISQRVAGHPSASRSSPARRPATRCRTRNTRW